MHLLLLARSVSTFLLVVRPEVLARYQGFTKLKNELRVRHLARLSWSTSRSVGLARRVNNAWTLKLTKIFLAFFPLMPLIPTGETHLALKSVVFRFQA
jgi:hypothetical protein